MGMATSKTGPNSALGPEQTANLNFTPTSHPQQYQAPPQQYIHSPGGGYGESRFDQLAGQATNLESVASHAFEKPSNAEAIVLFTKSGVPDPCALAGKSIIQIANDLVKQDNAVAFTVGEGPCAQCNVPTLFWWNGRDWQNAPLSDVPAVLRAINGYVFKQGLQVGYYLLGDKDLKITKFNHTITFNNGNAMLKDTCSSQQVQQVNSDVTKNLQQVMGSSGNALFWIILIILILVILWLLFRHKV